MKLPHSPATVSINRIKIMALPGLPVDEAVRGQQANHLLSNLAVIRYARQQATALELPAAYLEDSSHTRLTLPPFVDRCLDSSRPTVRAAAEAIGRRLGRNLGHILVTLHRGDPINQAARPDWSPKEWAAWRPINRIWLGGGLMSGRLGELIVASGQDYIDQIGYAKHISISPTPYRHGMMMLGVARYLPADSQHALCFDFGHTSVKRAYLTLQAGRLVGGYQFPPLPVEWDIYNQPVTFNRQTGQQLLEFVSQVIAQTWTTYHIHSPAEAVPLSPHLMLSLAAYVAGGRLLGNGLYATISSLAEDVRPLIAEAVQAKIGQPVQIQPLHDGTAASALHAGTANSAVLILGTAIGVGFPPASDQALRPISDEIRRYGLPMPEGQLFRKVDLLRYQFEVHHNDHL